ncbi:MAG TPA: STAS domain-containing protein [Actinomycetota bacterium]|nr:STAS domain-containing protein [Actinomycetota bacterium]
MGTDQAFRTRIDAGSGVTTVALLGELDMATVPILNDQLASLEQDGTKAIVLDLRDLRFVDSSGLHALVRAYRRSETNGHRLLLVGANPSTRRLCEMTGTEFLLSATATGEVLGHFNGDVSRTKDREGG